MEAVAHAISVQLARQPLTLQHARHPNLQREPCPVGCGRRYSSAVSR